MTTSEADHKVSEHTTIDDVREPDTTEPVDAEPGTTESLGAAPLDAESEADQEEGAQGDQEAALSSSPAREGVAPPARWWRRSGLLRGYRAAALLMILAGGLTALGIWFLTETTTLRTSDSADNQALVDVKGTNEVTAAITSAVNRVFSYSFDHIDRTEEAAAQVLRGQALEEYQALFPRVHELAPEQQLSVTADVAASAVQYLDDEHAELLVFLDQTATRESSAEPATAGAQLAVTAEREDSNWVITEIDPY